MASNDGRKQLEPMRFQFVSPPDTEPCPACGQQAVIMKMQQKLRPQSVLDVPQLKPGQTAVQTQAVGVAMWKLCLWCLWREYRSPSTEDNRWRLRATAGPGASMEPDRQHPGGAAALGLKNSIIEMGEAGETKIPSAEWLANEGLGEAWAPRP